jgi:N,N'-diacetyllegionaminate synthase
MITTAQSSRTPCLVIAEVGSVHDGSFGNATKLVDVAAECGADVIKFQTHIADAETLANAPMPRFFQSEPRHAYFQRTAFSLEQWQRLRAQCAERGIEFLSSPFSVEAVELLERVGVARYKVPSGEVTNLPLLEAIAQTQKPVLISSGMSSWEELDEAVETIVRHHRQVTVLQCTSAYPCPYEDVGLNAMREMGERYGLPVGLSDHTLTSYASLAAVAWGASVVEKHLTFSRRMYGSDAAHSMEPGEFADLVRGVRAVATMCASRVDKTAMAERLQDMKAVFEKSIVSRTAIAAGTPVTAAMVGLKKPGTGIPARRLQEFIGRRVIRDVARDTLLREDDFGA